MRRVVFVSALVLIIVTVGGFWYTLVEGFPVVDGFYQAVTTITTVGFGEVRPLDTSGRVFTMVYIFAGVGLLFWDLTAVVELVVMGPVADTLGIRRTRGKVRRMNEHFIICGYGRVGREVASELTSRHHQFVVIDRQSEVVADVNWPKSAVVVGNATEEAVLAEAGIANARGLIAAADSDTENTYIVLTARAMNPRIFIVARAGSDSAEKRMLAAGANRIVSPYKIGGRRLALSAVEPMLLDFLDHISAHQEAEDDNVLAEILVAHDAAFLIGMTLAEAMPPEIHVMGIERPSGRLQVGPSGTAQIGEGDRLLLYGPAAAIESLAAQNPAYRELKARH